eukprot:5591411-Pyramimonas_sp.AAC.1
MNDGPPFFNVRGVARADPDALSYELDGRSPAIDFFLIDKHLDPLAEVTALADMPATPHRPVLLKVARVADQTGQVLKRHQNIASDRVVGPIREAPNCANLEGQ